MASSVHIDTLDHSDTALVAHLFNNVFRPERDEAFFQRRLRNRLNPLVLAARVENDAAGFFVGMELKPTVYFSWLVGVMPDARRMGVATKLMRTAEDWASEHGYASLRFECTNRHRPMLHFGIANGYDVIGVRWDADRNENLLIIERRLDTTDPKGP